MVQHFWLEITPQTMWRLEAGFEAHGLEPVYQSYIYQWNSFYKYALLQF